MKPETITVIACILCVGCIINLLYQDYIIKSQEKTINYKNETINNTNEALLTYMSMVSDLYYYVADKEQKEKLNRLYLLQKKFWYDQEYVDINQYRKEIVILDELRTKVTNILENHAKDIGNNT